MLYNYSIVYRQFKWRTSLVPKETEILFFVPRTGEVIRRNINHVEYFENYQVDDEYPAAYVLLKSEFYLRFIDKILEPNVYIFLEEQRLFIEPLCPLYCYT